MLQLKFSSNPNGKLFQDIFGDIRIADYEKFQPGNVVEIIVGKQSWGKAEVVGFKDFSFTRITDTIAHMNCGRASAYQAKLLKNFYGDLQDDAQLMHIVFKWTLRFIEVQQPAMTDWWQIKVDQFPQTNISYHNPDEI